MFESQKQNSDLPYKERERGNAYHYKLTCKVREYRFCYVRSRDIILHVMCAWLCNDRSQHAMCYVFCCVFCNMRHCLTNISFCNKFCHILPIFSFFFFQNYLHGAKERLLKSFPLKIHDTELRHGIETVKNKQTVT